ncbi:MAG: hypothetical protein ACI93R_002311 [Flavobacteriales bacterium]|jgi:hypothetical protein
MNIMKQVLRASVLSLPILLSACGGDDNNNDEVRDLEARVGGIETRLSTIETQNTATAANINGIDDSLVAIELRLAGLETDTALADEIVEIAALIDALELRLDEVESVTRVSFEVVLQNVTQNQPIAPAAVLLHDDAYKAWQIGQSASIGLETLAESGSPLMLIAEATEVFSSATGNALLMPGESDTVLITADISAVAFAAGELNITIAGMPVHTNDAFSGVSGWDLSGLGEGESLTALLPIYDAGTELNSEAVGTIPGPDVGGEGMNVLRDDVADQVTRHPGVVTSDDGYEDSALNQSHRFDNGALLVKVTRL